MLSLRPAKGWEPSPLFIIPAGLQLMRAVTLLPEMTASDSFRVVSCIKFIYKI